MNAYALLAAVALLSATPARAEDAASPFVRLQSAAEPSERIRACNELTQPPHRGPRAYQALNAAMERDLSERVRLAAAVAVITYPDGPTLGRLDSFLKAEPGGEVRRQLLVALSTAPAQIDNPDATRLIASSLAEDSSVEVRLAAAAALGARKDASALGAVRLASEKDANKSVREAARRALLVLSRPPKPKPKPNPPNPPKLDAVLGKDPCPRPWGWCICAGAITLKPKCLTHPECRSLHSDMRSHNLVCKWDSQSED